MIMSLSYVRKWGPLFQIERSHVKIYLKKNNTIHPVLLALVLLVALINSCFLAVYHLKGLVCVSWHLKYSETNGCTLVFSAASFPEAPITMMLPKGKSTWSLRKSRL